MKSANVTDQVSPVVVLRDSGTTTRSACGKGSGASSTDCTTLKIAVVEAMPSASVTTAAALNDTLLRSERTAYASSWTSTDI